MGFVRADVGGLLHPARKLRVVLHVVPALHQAAARDGDLRVEGSRSAEDEDRWRRRALMPGVIGAFHELDAAVSAIGELRRAGFREINAYTPTPRHELEHALEAPPSRVRIFTLVGGLCGATFGYWIAVWASRY